MRQALPVGVPTLLGDCLSQLDSDYEALREAVADALEIGLKELPTGVSALTSMSPSKVWPFSSLLCRRPTGPQHLAMRSSNLRCLPLLSGLLRTPALEML